MPTAIECICCTEIEQITNTMEQFTANIQCITEHAGFEAVCLNVWVLQAAFFSYRQQYGTQDVQGQPLNEYVPDSHVYTVQNIVLIYTYRQYRFTAYRQLTGWCWGWLGRKVRVVLPSCAVTAIRKKFPSQQYTGFQYPSLDE